LGSLDVGILRAAIIFFAYIGFDAVPRRRRKAKNPEKDMPIGILGSLVICTVLITWWREMLTGLVKLPTNLMVPDPLAGGIDATGCVGAACW